jgi:hypothetical protein
LAESKVYVRKTRPYCSIGKSAASFKNISEYLITQREQNADVVLNAAVNVVGNTC